jgi:HAE1 family hydrophobic/amphiphilic exporter-1
VRALITYAVHHRVTMLMVTAAAVLFGIVSLGRLPVQLLPDLNYPTLTVQTELPDAGPSEVENLVTRPLEEAVGVVPGVRRISSTSESGLSEIVLEFGWGTDMDFAALDVREKIDLISLPDEAKAPALLRYDPSLDPVLRLGLSGDANPILLRYLAEHVVKKDLESLPGVAAAKVVGGLTEEVHVDVDEARLASLGIPMNRVAEVLGSENVNAAGGRLRDRESEYLVRTLNQYTGPEDVAGAVLYRDNDRVVKLGDVATVTRAFKEREIITRINGKTAVEIAIYKEGNANIVETAARVTKRLPQLQKILPTGVRASVLSDQSTFIRASIHHVQTSAMIGGLLAILILLVFLRDLRATAIIALAIPTSIVTTFVLMYRQGITMNVMSLGGLALGIGMLVDNSIVVLESIVRHLHRGGTTRAQAVIDGTEEVAMAISSSTFTAVAVFLPILFVEGIARQIFKDQALTVTYSLLVSLVSALTLTPMLAALGKGTRVIWNPFRKRAPEAAASVGFAKPEKVEDVTKGRMAGAYRSVLTAALAHRPQVIVSAVVLFVAAIFGLKALGTNLIPPLSQNEFRFSIEMPEATPIEHTNEVVSRIETSLHGIPNMEAMFTNIGLDARESGSVRAKRENHAELNVRLTHGLSREVQNAALDEIRRRLVKFPEVTANLEQPTVFTVKTPVEVEIYGYNIDDLTSVSNKVAGVLAGIQGLKDITKTMELGNPEVQVRFDRDKLKMAGLDLRGSSEALRTHILGKVATDYKERDRQIDVRVRGQDAENLDFADLGGLVVGYREGAPVRLAAVADVAVSRGPARIQRISQSRAAVVSASVVGRDLGTVSAEIENALTGVPLPPDITVDLAGQNEEMKRSMKSLVFASLLAVFLVYMVMACQFESLLDPFLILLAVPMALIGVVAWLFLTHTAVSVMVMIGGIMLAGIVVNNGIVLLDLVGRLRKRGYTVREAIMEGGSVRLRPILMTKATTVLGLVPIALGRGEGGELMQPLAITVIGGLTVSTLLTLVVVPVLYTFVHRDKAKAAA